MAYAFPPAGILEVTVRASLFGETIMNIGHFRYDADNPNPDGGQLIDSTINQFDGPELGVSSLLSQFTTTEFLIREVVAQLIYPTRYARRVYPAATGAGIVAPPTAPSNVSAVATKRSDAAGRHGHGQIHMGGFDLESLGNNRIAQETVDLMDAYAAWWIQTLTVDGGLFTPIIFNRTTPAQSPMITSVSMSNEPRTMRRRGVRLGI